MEKMEPNDWDGAYLCSDPRKGMFLFFWQWRVGFFAWPCPLLSRHLNTGGGSVNLPKLIGRFGRFLPHLLSLPCRCPCRKYHHWTWDVTRQSNMAAGLQLWQVLWYFGSLYQMLYNTVTRSVCWAHTVFIRASSKWLMLPEVKTNQFACTRAPEADRHVNQAEARSAISAIKYNVRMDTNAVWIWVCTISETAPRLLYGEPPECHKRSLSAILIYFNLK